jgi:hypothetical protein
VRELFAGRFAIRHSDAPPGSFGTKTLAAGEDPAGAIVCPAQTGRSDCCGTCALCWSTPKTIAFREH